MVNFDMLNNRTRDFNNNNINVSRSMASASSASVLFVRRNNETFKKNNGMYPFKSF